MFNRIKQIMSHPQAAWDAIARDEPGAGVLLSKFILPLALLAPIATAVGMRVFDTGWNAEYGYSALRDRAFQIAAATYIFQIVSIYLLAAIFFLLARTEGRKPSFLVALRVAVFGSIPVMLSGALLVIPFNTIFTLIAMMYSFYLYYLGAERLIGIRPADSAMFIGVAMFCMIVLSGAMGGIASAMGLI
jgi:hypothetical protein